MTTQAEELKPCPFCGGNPIWSCCSLDCNRCGATYRARDTYEETQNGWNTRASSWQPISKAPRDGTRFLAATTIKNHRLVIAFYTKDGLLLNENMHPCDWPMLYWQPLPEPPDA